MRVADRNLDIVQLKKNLPFLFPVVMVIQRGIFHQINNLDIHGQGHNVTEEALEAIRIIKDYIFIMFSKK